MHHRQQSFGWQADHGRMDEVVGCTCHDKRTEMAGNDDTPKRIKNQRWENLAKSVRELEKYKKNPIIYTEQKISGQMSLDGINGG